MRRQGVELARGRHRCTLAQSRFERGNPLLELDDLRNGARRESLIACQRQGAAKIEQIALAVDPTAARARRMNESRAFPVMKRSPMDAKPLSDFTDRVHPLLPTLISNGWITVIIATAIG